MTPSVTSIHACLSPLMHTGSSPKITTEGSDPTQENLSKRRADTELFWDIDGL